VSEESRLRDAAVKGPRVGVLDYGSGNLHSACRALAATGAEVVLSSQHAELLRCDGLVVPGVGAFAACMQGLLQVGGDALVARWLDSGRRLLGICVGHQVLFEQGDEHGVVTRGLGVLPGRVELLRARRLPHMGWNLVESPADSLVFAGLAGERFYFVHSYGVHLPEGGAPAGLGCASMCTHETDRFVAAVETDLVTSTQFHPEKSGAAGARLLRNWVSCLTSASRC